VNAAESGPNTNQVLVLTLGYACVVTLRATPFVALEEQSPGTPIKCWVQRLPWSIPLVVSARSKQMHPAIPLSDVASLCRRLPQLDPLKMVASNGSLPWDRKLVPPVPQWDGGERSSVSIRPPETFKIIHTKGEEHIQRSEDSLLRVPLAFSSMSVRTLPLMFGHDIPLFNLAAMLSRPSITGISLLVFVAVVIFLRSTYYRYFHPLSKVPGNRIVILGQQVKQQY